MVYCTLSPTIMVQWKMAVFERELLLEGPTFHFHDYGRKDKFLEILPQSSLD